MHGAVAPEGPDWRKDGQALIVGRAARGRRDRRPAATPSQEVHRRRARGLARTRGWAASGPLNADFIDAVYGSFPLMIALISLLTFLLLARAFRSLLLPLKAVILNILSVGAAWGVMTLVWQSGHGSEEIWGIAATGSMNSCPGVDFEVITDASGSYDDYTGIAEYELLDGVVLQVVPGDKGRVNKILYGVGAWSRVEVLSGGETPPP